MHSQAEEKFPARSLLRQFGMTRQFCAFSSVLPKLSLLFASFLRRPIRRISAYISFKNPSLEVWYRTYVKSSAAIPSLLWFQIRFRYTVYICITYIYIYCTFVYYAKPTLFGCQLCVDQVLLILLFTCRLAKFGRWHDAILLHLGARQASAT